MPGFKYSELPPKLSPYTYFGFQPQRQIENEFLGNCPLCFSDDNKFYVNGETGQFSCKHGSCGEEGNVHSFIQKAFAVQGENGEASIKDWRQLEEARNMPIEVLKRMGLVKVGGNWLLPIKNEKGIISSLQVYKIGQKLRAIKYPPTGLYGAEQFADKKKTSWPVYLCEGAWDKAALEIFLEKNGVKAIVLGTPGAYIFKDNWLHLLRGRGLYTLFDRDVAGIKGTSRIHRKVEGIVSFHKVIQWPEDSPKGFDTRDFINEGGTYDAFSQLIEDYDKTSENTSDDSANTPVFISGKFSYAELPRLSKYRPTIEQTMAVFEKHLKMTDDLRAALKAMYAGVITTQMAGDALWLHFVGPPGWGKTELLRSCNKIPGVEMLDTITESSLISGARLKDGADASLIPTLFNKTVIFKDFTEILQGAKPERDGIYRILRGAYDGICSRTFGNGIQSRKYEGTFTCLSGVTHEIAADPQANMGDRFLMFKAINDPNRNSDEQISAAIKNTDHQVTMREKLHEASRNFLEWRIEKEDYPEIPYQYEVEIVALAQIIEILRTTVSKDYSRGHVNYRPEHGVGTRPAIELTKLAMGLGLLKYPAKITDDDMQIVRHVALSSCISWNMEAVFFLSRKPKQTVDELSLEADIPVITLREQLEQLCLIRALKKEYKMNPLTGRVTIPIYSLSENFQRHWDASKIQQNSYLKGNQIRTIKPKLKFKRIK